MTDRCSSAMCCASCCFTTSMASFPPSLVVEEEGAATSTSSRKRCRGRRVKLRRLGYPCIHLSKHRRLEHTHLRHRHERLAGPGVEDVDDRAVDQRGEVAGADAVGVMKGGR